MAEKVTIDVEVKDNTKSLKQQLREAQKEVQNLTNEFGSTSKQVAEAAKKAADLKDKIDDANDAIQSFKGGGAFVALGRATQSLASGFTAAQGALNLFGTESKDVEKALLKVNSAMALSQGLAGLEDLGRSFKQVGSVAVNAFKGIKAAIGGLGIGIIVLAITAIVSNWKELVGWIEKTFPAFKGIQNFFKNFYQNAMGTLSAIVAGFKTVAKVVGDVFRGDFSGAYKDATKIGENMAKAYNKGYNDKDKELREERYLKNKKFELDLLEAQGKEVSTKRLELLKRELKQLEKGSDEYNSKLIEIEKLRTTIRENEEKKREEISKKAEEARNKRLEKEKQILSDEKARREKDFQETQEIGELELKTRAELNGEKLTKARELVNQNNELQKQEYENFKFWKDQEKKHDEKTQQAKFQSVQSSLTAISQLVTAFAGQSEKQQKRAFEINKAIGIAQATIDTYKAANSALAEVPYPYNFVAAGVAVASGLANVAMIAKQQFNSPSISSGGMQTQGTPSVGNGFNTTPNINIVGFNQQSQIAQLNQQPIQAYVVSGQVTTQQALDRNRLRNATF